MSTVFVRRADCSSRTIKGLVGSGQFAGISMRPAGFEPATRGLEVRRFIHQNADSAAWLSQIVTLSSRICYPRLHVLELSAKTTPGLGRTICYLKGPGAYCRLRYDIGGRSIMRFIAFRRRARAGPVGTNARDKKRSRDRVLPNRRDDFRTPPTARGSHIAA